MFKKILLFLLISSPVFAQVNYNDTFTRAWWHASPIDSLYLNMNQIRAGITGGSGTVTTFSATGNNGISTSVSNPTTTPALTLGITNLSIMDTSLALNSVTTAKIANSAVTLPKIANINNNTILGNNTGGSAAPVALTTANVKTMLGYTSSFTSTTYDLNSGTVGGMVRDIDIPDTLIQQTSKSAIQWKYVVTSADSVTTPVIGEYAFYLVFGGKNTDAVNSRTINWHFTVNSTEKGVGDGSQAIAVATPFWKAAVLYLSAAIKVGDTIGLKLWASAANLVDLRYATIYFIPRKYVSGSGLLSGQCLLTTTSRTTVSGAVSGVSYVAQNFSASPSFWDLTANAQQGNLSAGIIFTIGAGSAVAQFNNFTDANNSGISAVTAGASLYSVNGGTTSGLIRYLYLYTVTTN